MKENNKPMKKDNKELGEIYVEDIRTPGNQLGITGGEFAAEQERDMKLAEEKSRRGAVDQKPPEETDKPS